MTTGFVIVAIALALEVAVMAWGFRREQKRRMRRWPHGPKLGGDA